MARVAANDNKGAADGLAHRRVPRLRTLGTLALEGGAPGAPVLGPRKLALLAYLALADRPLTRDHLAELFWGDRDDDRARHSLREALSAFRAALGSDAIARGGDVVALAGPSVLTVDARELRAASAAGDVARTIALHAGPFLDGVHVTGVSSAFERWLIAERTDLERLVSQACATECRRLREVGDWAACTRVAERWLDGAPLDARAGRALLRSLAAPGTRAALRNAIDAYQRLATQLYEDFELAPDPSVVALAEEYGRALAGHEDSDKSVHSAPQAASDGLVGVAHGPAVTREPTPVVERPVSAVTAAHRLPKRRRSAFALLAAGAVVLVGTVEWASQRTARPLDHRDAKPAAPYVAVIATAGDLSPDDCWLAPAMPHLLATALARAARLETIALPAATTTRANATAGCVTASSDSAALEAARQAGATLAVRPTLTRTAAGFALDLDVRDARDGRVVHRELLTDSVPFTLAERAAVAVAGALTTLPDGPPGTLVAVETRSVEAYVAYVEAMQQKQAGHGFEATAALDRAIALDSGFVSALAERLRVARGAATHAAVDTLHRLALALKRHIERASPYDRLDFDITMATLDGEHARAEQLARELSLRFPHDDRARGRYVGLLMDHGRFEEAVAEIQHALQSDSLSAARHGKAEDCGLCVSRLTMAGLLVFENRLDDAERETRRLVADFPDWPSAWNGYSELLAGRGRWDEAIAAAERARLAASGDPWYAFEPARRLVEAGRYDEAARRLRPWLHARDREMALAAADVEAARLRELGRHREAVQVLMMATRATGPAPTAYDLVRGASLAALGDARAAEQAYATPPPRLDQRRTADDWLLNQDARLFTWSRALLADALVVAADARGEQPDTVRLRALADSMETIGGQSYFARDWRLHHHVRGLIAARAGRWTEAVAEFQQARWTRTGWTRTLVELARAELGAGHPDRALAALADARGAVLNSMGRYATRTEIALWTARAYEAAGQLDSAQAYADVVRRAWRDADPPVRRRLAWLPAEGREVDNPQPRGRQHTAPTLGRGPVTRASSRLPETPSGYMSGTPGPRR